MEEAKLESKVDGDRDGRQASLIDTVDRERSRERCREVSATSVNRNTRGTMRHRVPVHPVPRDQ